MKKILPLMLVFSITFVLMGCATLWTPPEKNDLKIVDHQIHRDKKAIIIRAVHVPGLLEKGAALEYMVPAMAKIAKVGANGICLDLAGFSADGKSLDPAVAETIESYAERAKDQRMFCVINVLGDSRDSTFRKNAVRSAAKVLGTQRKALYIIDGPDAPPLAASFKRLAPNLVLAAPENGDVKIMTDPAVAGNNGLVLLSGSLPEEPWGNTNYLLPDNDQSYTMLDEAYTNPVEKMPWTPDNSKLSEEEQAEGFVSLFNGVDLDNWWNYYHEGESFRINDDGYLECYKAGAGGLVTRDRYEDFILRLEYKFNDADANSGIHLWVPRAARQSKIGFEIQLMGDSDLKEPHDTSTGAVYDVVPALTVATHPEGEWNALEIQTQGSHLKVTLNGIIIQDFDMDEVEELRYRLRKGFIDLQDHDDYVVFRNIRIKEL
ncbi:MAG: DUF1080 domain-containing protein [Candidatus Hydrogenedentes bacterium]|nr:DUF1080 domain-containing protein [Candidatus Hydrogenedentota bacterium]